VGLSLIVVAQNEQRKEVEEATMDEKVSGSRVLVEQQQQYLLDQR